MFRLKMTCPRLSSSLNFLFIKQRNTCFKSNLFFFLCFYQWGLSWTLPCLIAKVCWAFSLSFTVLSTMEHEKKPRERFFICGLIEYSWPLNSVSFNCADPLIHWFFPVDSCSSFDLVSSNPGCSRVIWWLGIHTCGGQT